MSDTGDFYEPDEPVSEVLAAFEAGEKRVTVAPGSGHTETLLLGWGLTYMRPRGTTEYLSPPDPRLLAPVADRPTTKAAAA